MKYLISSLIIFITHFGIILGISLLYWLEKIPDIVYLILMCCLIVTFLESLGISAEKYLTPIIGKNE